MTKSVFFVLALLALTVPAPAPLSDGAAHAQTTAKKKYPPLKGVIYGRKRPGGYTYKYVDGINTRRFVDLSQQTQSRNGPFDSGFFFSTPTSPYGGDAPYMH